MDVMAWIYNPNAMGKEETGSSLGLLVSLA